MTGDWSPCWVWLCCWMGSWRSNVWTDDVRSVCRYLCLLLAHWDKKKKRKKQSSARAGRVVFRTATPRCSLLLYNLTSGVILWPFIHFRGLVLLWFLISGRHQLVKLWPGDINLLKLITLRHSEIVLLAHSETRYSNIIDVDTFIKECLYFLGLLGCSPRVSSSES